MLKFLFSLIVLNFSILSIASAQNYELGKEYTFSSGNVEMTVKLDEKGNATIARKKVQKYAEPTTSFFGKEGDFILKDNGLVEFKDEKTASGYWIIPFDDEPVARGGNVQIVVTCICIKGEGSCSPGFRRTSPSGSKIDIYCVPDIKCQECSEPKVTGRKGAVNVLVLKCEEVIFKK